MFAQRNFLLVAAMATAAARPAMGHAPSAGTTVSKTHSAASVPNFSRVWTHPAFPWFEPPAFGPGPITNLSRWPEQRPQTEGGSAALPASKVGVSNYDQLVGDHKSPILQPWAAEGGQAVWRNVAGRHHVPQPLEPMLTFADAVHLQVGYAPCV